MEQTYRPTRATFTGSMFSMGESTNESHLEKLEQRERQMVELLGCEKPERILHDLRNVLNELQLLRILTQQERQ